MFLPPLSSGRHAPRVTMSAKVAAQKFSFPFSSAARLSQEELSQKGCVQVKAVSLQDLQQSPSLSSTGAVRRDAAIHESPKLPPGGHTAGARFPLCPDSSQSGVKLTVDGEDQRPATKRQLSSESAARTITAVKKSAVRTETEEPKTPKPKTHPGQRVSEQRRCRKDLFTSSEVFHRIDSHAVRTGAEVTPPALLYFIPYRYNLTNRYIPEPSRL